MDNHKGKCVRVPNGSYLLIDSFEGALSDFADETVVDAYGTKGRAVQEVIDRVHCLAQCHKDEFVADEMPPFPSDEDMLSELSRKWELKYVSADGCKYTWQIFFNRL